MESATESEPIAARAGDAPRPLLAFLHIPKAAGTTLGRLLRVHYGDGFERINQYRRGELERAARTGDPVTLELPHVRAVTGHLAFGLLERLFPEAQFVTILRDPLQRTLSQYEYMLHRVGRPWNTESKPAPTADLTIGDALERGYVADNLQTRMLCGTVSPDDALPAGALEQAKRNLAERFAYVGTTERFAEFLALLNVSFGWPTIAYKEGRVTRGRRPLEEWSPAELRLVEEANVLDRELFAAAETLAERGVASRGAEVEAEAEVLRRALPARRLLGQSEFVADPASVRSLPVEARVVLALKEAQLSRTRELLESKTRKTHTLRRKARRREERITELKRALARSGLRARLGRWKRGE